MNKDLLIAVQALHGGGVVAHPTETCYGLACDIFQKNAVQKLYKLKNMHESKPVSILVRDADEALRYGVFDAKALFFAKKYWPGALTIIVKRTNLLPHWINPDNDSIGIRVSSNKHADKLINAFGSPITTTSANVHGMPEAYSVDEFLLQALVPDAVIDAGSLPKNPPSTILNLQNGSFELIREGAVRADELKKIYDLL